MTKPSRLLVICPPNLATNWHQEISRTGITQNAINGELLQIKPTKKTFLFPKTGIIICPDTLLTARPGLQKQIKQWKPEAAIIDESHRYKNPYAKRTKTILRICHPTPNVLALTGTPIVSSPVDLFATLSILGKLRHFPEDFVNTYTVKNYWGDRKPNPGMLPDLYDRLDKHVWIRRTKNQVLKDLPPKTRAHQTIDLTKAELDTVFAPLKQKMAAWETGPKDPEVLAEHAKRYVSQARKATGLAKIPAATEWIINHHTGTGRPLIAWIIHKKVATLLNKNLEKAGLKTAIYNGNTPASDRNQIVEDFQAGKIDVLIGQITAAGVGLTLTRTQDALFVETEWTPALIVQAEDRIHRITQTSPVTITTLIATGTLDPVIHKILSQKIKTLDALTPGSDHQVTSSSATGASTTRFLAWLLANHL
ncbi:MAG: DEAD/DEAH box helicase [Varibaculum cambriense]|nr:DEAD/DEAH box helicase [Varibaculum cambriense]